MGDRMGIVFEAFGREIYIHDAIINSWVIVIALSIFAIIVGTKLKKVNPSDKPTGIQNVLELLVEGVRSLVTSTMGAGKTRDFLMPYIGTLAIYLACANLFGLLGFTPPTSDFNVTLALAIITFVMTQYYGLKTNGLGGYIKGYFEPVPFLVPLNIIGEIANPISLSFRLFGNILSGVIIMGLIYQGFASLGLLGWLGPIVTPIFHAYFDIFSGLIQTFIFIMLTMVFVGGNLPEKENA